MGAHHLHASYLHSFEFLNPDRFHLCWKTIFFLNKSLMFLHFPVLTANVLKLICTNRIAHSRTEQIEDSSLPSHIPGE